MPAGYEYHLDYRVIDAAAWDYVSLVDMETYLEGASLLPNDLRGAVEYLDLSVGRIIDYLGRRRGEMVHMDTLGSLALIEFLIPARGLIGARTALLTLSQGEATLSHVFETYRPDGGPIPRRTNGVLIADRDGHSPFVDVDQLVVNASWTSLFRMAPVLDELSLQHPQLHLARTAPQQFNFSDLIGKFTGSPAKPDSNRRASRCPTSACTTATSYSTMR